MEIELPENMADLSAEELTALIAQLEEAGAELAAYTGDDADIAETIVAVASALDEAQAAFDALKTDDESAGDDDAVAAAKARFAAKDDAEEEKTAEASTEESEEASADDDKTAELSTEEGDEKTDDAEAAAPAAAPAELSVSLDTSGLEKVLADFATTVAENAAPAAPAAPKAKKISTLALKRAGAGDEKASDKADAGAWAQTTATDAFGQNKRAGEAVTVGELARAISAKSSAMGGVAGFSDRLPLAQSVAEFADGRKLTGDIEADYEILRTARNDWNALVASGGNCAPLQVSYEFTRLAMPQSPVEGCLPTVGAPRGGIRYIPQTNFRDAAGGVRITTEAEDQAGYTTQTPPGPTPPKPCVRVTCPAIQECRVDAISQCVTFGNLNFRAFPEQVESFLQDLAVIYAETKEIYYLDAIEAASTNVTAGLGFGYGMVRDLINDLCNATVAYRRRNNMDDGAPLDVYVPSWVVAMAKVDMVNDHSLGLSFVGADVAAALTAAFASINVNVCFYYHGATGAGQDFNAAQADGTALNPWPSTVVSYIHAPGTFVRLDGGTLDLGIVRDSALNGTNDLQIFAEQWIQVCHLGQEALRIEHTLCPNGGAPEPATLAVCL